LNRRAGRTAQTQSKQTNLTKQMQNKHVGNLRAAKQYRRSAKHKKQNKQNSQPIKPAKTRQNKLKQTDKETTKQRKNTKTIEKK
jgi:hypothetical protein